MSEARCKAGAVNLSSSDHKRCCVRDCDLAVFVPFPPVHPSLILLLVHHTTWHSDYKWRRRSPLALAPPLHSATCLESVPISLSIISRSCELNDHTRLSRGRLFLKGSRTVSSLITELSFTLPLPYHRAVSDSLDRLSTSTARCPCSHVSRRDAGDHPRP